MSDIEYYSSGNSNSSFYVGAHILNILFLHDIFYICLCIVNAKFDKAIYLSFF